MNKFENSFIDAAITEISESKTANIAYVAIAKKVQSAPGDNPLTRIANTLPILRNDMRQARQVAELTGDTFVAPAAKPGNMLGFVQAVMHKVCWNARKLHRANLEQEEQDQANGVDFTQDVAEQLDVQPMSMEAIADAVDTDYRYLLNVHTWLAGRFDFDDVNDFYVYVVRKAIPQDELAPEAEGAVKFEITHAAMSFDEALPVMESVLDEMRERDAATEAEEANVIDFTETAAAAA